jgi:hypothetical protein
MRIRKGTKNNFNFFYCNCFNPRTVNILMFPLQPTNAQLFIYNSISLLLVNYQRDTQILFYVFISIYNSLHVSSTSSPHHHERQILSIQPLVTVILCWWPSCVHVFLNRLGHQHSTTVTKGCIDTIYLS